MTLNELTYNIRNIAKAGGLVDDERLSSRQVAEWLNYYRAMFIKRDVDKGKTISDNISQDLGCVEMIQVDSAECCQAETGCMILRTKLELPKPLELNYSDSLTYVGLVGGVRGYEPSTAVRAGHWDNFNKWTSQVSKYYFQQGHVYITHKEMLKWINIKGVFEDPRDAARFSHCSGSSCWTADSEYPISAWMQPLIIEQIMQKELKLYLGTSADTINNATGVDTRTGTSSAAGLGQQAS